MQDNTHRFTGRATDYDRYRQRYPGEEILAYLRDWCGLTTDSVVADIGAGTGMLAEVFLANGNRVFAVEPNADMREPMRGCVEQQLGGFAGQLEIIDATAEATALADASVDIVAAGRAFHWFDKERALAEFRRILRPGGWITLIAADRDRDAKDPQYREQADAFEKLMAEYGLDYMRVRSGYRSYGAEESLDSELRRAQIHGVREMDWTALLGYARSLSVTPPADHPGYAAFESALHRHFDAYALDGILTVPTICWVNAGRLRAQ